MRDGRVADIAAGDHSAALRGSGLAVQHGAFLMPGLVDAHVHLFLDGASTDLTARSAHLKQPLEGLLQAARDSARQSLACGVTLVRDAGDRHGINHQIRAEARLPGSAMAQVRSGGMGIKRAGRYGGFMAQDVQDAPSMREAVRALALDSDEIKLILTGIIILFATAGDLFESLIKRSLNIKDSGSILPGHGGILDRFDSVFISAPFVLVFYLVRLYFL